MEREHLIAGVVDRKTGRAHHSDEIPGYTGKGKIVRHGQAYPSSKTGFIEYHGLTDNLSGPDHKKAIAAARRRLARESSGLYPRMSEAYKRPPVGY